MWIIKASKREGKNTAYIKDGMGKGNETNFHSHWFIEFWLMELRELLEETHLPPSFYKLKITKSWEVIWKSWELRSLVSVHTLGSAHSSITFSLCLLCALFHYCLSTMDTLCIPLVLYSLLYLSVLSSSSFSSISSSIMLLMHQGVWRKENDWHALWYGVGIYFSCFLI